MKLTVRIGVALMLSSIAATSFAQKVSKVSLALPSVVGGVATSGTVEISAKAGATGAVIALTSSQPFVIVPSSVTIPSGQTSVAFPITSLAVASNGTSAIKATLAGVTEGANLRVEAPQVAELIFIPISVQGGSVATATLKISSAAPVGGMKVLLPSTTKAWGGPEFVLVPAGSTAASFSFTTVPVGAKVDATISAFTTGDRVPAILTLTPPILTSFTLSPSNVVGGNTATGTLTLNGPAPKEGVRITLTSETNFTKVAETVLIPAGQTTATIAISTKSVAEKTVAGIIARAPASSIEHGVTIVLPTIESFTLGSASTTGGSAVTGTVTLNGQAPIGGYVITLSSSQGFIKVPVTITVPAGSSSVSFAILTSDVRANDSASITVIGPVGKGHSATLGVLTKTTDKKSSGN